MNIRAFAITIIFAALATTALADGSHGGGHPVLDFEIGENAIRIRIIPENFTPETPPQIVAMVTDRETSVPVFDADLLVRLSPSGETNREKARGRDASALDFGVITPASTPLDLSGFVPLIPGQQAGKYQAAYPVASPGTYELRLAIRALDDRNFTEPILTSKKILYLPPSRAPMYRRFAVMVLMVFTALTITMLLWSRKRGQQTPGEPIDLLDFPGVKQFLLSRWYQPFFQLPTMLIFAMIILIGFIGPTAGDKNLATLLTWTIWWAGIIFSFILMGRIWCMMCPFGTAQDWIGRHFSLGRTFPAQLRNIWLSSFLFLGLTWWDSYSGIVNNPAMTAWLLIAFLLLASITAVIYKGRSFCRYICPIGGLIGLYSMFSPIALRSRCRKVCQRDPDKGCIHGTAINRPCPMHETPMTLDRNNYCNLCGECLKGCSQNNIVLQARPFGRDLWTTTRGTMDEAFLAMALVGLTVLVTAEMIEPWHGFVDRIISLIPLASLGITSHAGQEKAIFTILLLLSSLILPGLLLWMASLAVKKGAGSGHALSVRQIFIRFAYMFIPVGLSMHLAHNSAHLLREGVEVVPAGLRLFSTLSATAANVHPAPLMGMEALFWLQMLILVLLNGFSLYAGYRIAMRDFPEHPLAAFIPMAILAVAFMLINVYVLGQPMALRHTH